MDDLRTNALAELVVHIGKRDAFHQLRTVEQLGYMVFCTAYWSLTVRNVALIIQSNAHSAEHLESRVEAFLPAVGDALRVGPWGMSYVRGSCALQESGRDAGRLGRWA